MRTAERVPDLSLLFDAFHVLLPNVSGRVTVGTAADGRTVAIKRASTDDGRQRLRHEHDMLRASGGAGAAGAGVVEVAAFDDPAGGDVTALSTVWSGGPTLASSPPGTPEAVASIAAELAATVADVHDRSIAHTRLTAEHVLLDAANHPILTGFAEATGDVDDQPADVAAFGTILTRLLTDLPPSAPATILRGRVLGARGGADRLVPSLTALASRASDSNLSTRPTARSLATSLAVLAAGPAPTGSAAPGPTTTASPRLIRPTAPAGRSAARPARAAAAARAWRLPGPRRAWFAVAAAVLVLGFVIGRWAFAGGGSAPATATATSVAEATTATSVTDATTAGEEDVTAAFEPSASASDAAGDSAAAPGGSAAGTPSIVEDGGRRYAIGSATDRVVVGDWDCDGVATPAVLRPSTGEVSVFARWSGPGETVVATPLTVVPGATGLQAVTTPGSTCAQLEADLPGGERQVLTVGLPAIDPAPPETTP